MPLIQKNIRMIGGMILKENTTSISSFLLPFS